MWTLSSKWGRSEVESLVSLKVHVNNNKKSTKQKKKSDTFQDRVLKSKGELKVEVSNHDF